MSMWNVSSGMFTTECGGFLLMLKGQKHFVIGKKQNYLILIV